MKKIPSNLLSASLLISMLFNFALPASAEYKILDTIIATVDNDVITQSDFDKKIVLVNKNLQNQKQQMPDAAEIQKQVLDRLIIDSIQLQMAQKAGISITDEHLNQSMMKMAEKQKLTLDDFRNKIQEDGGNYLEIREQVRQEMTIQQLQQGNLRNKIQINEQEVENYLASTDGKKQIATRYKIRQILLPIEENSTNADVEKAQKNITDLRQKIIQENYDTSELMGEKNINGVQYTGTQMAWMEKNDLPSLFADAVGNLKKGEISQPIRSGAGWHLISLTDISGGEEIVHQTSSRHILIKPSEVRSDEKSKAKIDDIYIRLLKGEDFSLLAQEYSEDKGSALEGGELGWNGAGQFVPIFESTLNSLKNGEISKPFKSEFGWHIVQKNDTRDHNITAENTKNKAYQAIYERKFMSELEAWLITIREEAFVEIR